MKKYVDSGLSMEKCQKSSFCVIFSLKTWNFDDFFFI